MTSYTTGYKYKNKTLSVLSIAGVALTLGIAGCSNSDKAEPATNAEGTPATTEGQDIELLNVSYDVARDFYKDYNPLFVEHYKAENPNSNILIKQSHGGSSKQALSVANGLQADVATMNQGSDIELLEKKGLVEADWESKFPDNAVPFTSTIVFLVRKDNPKGINDWQDLTKEGVEIVMANPKVTGNGRYAFLGAYGYGLHAFNKDETQAKNYVKDMLKNVKVYENGGRAATTTFVQRGIGDVLVTFENEANLAATDFGLGKVDIVYPKYSIKSESPVAVVKTVTDKKGTTDAAKAYLDYLWSEPAQQLAANLYLRPSVKSVLDKNSDKLPPIDTFRPNDAFGTWDEIMSTYFSDGGVFDQLAINAPK
ncbi:sulfate ABC transporter substrate-binding protein [Psychrobacter sp. WB2]|jgi:sulfate transport system substrate-binding protein|uniref:sulfate ABC transporter substrate-binding protein n=1 Tax=Psychrobacter TaxID=497 RepID=UPI00248CC882|nr:sulfate ABC transporter substrate-binding protein [Psychrobacter sp. WB2]WGV14142.1 sulfate ABC transporter substrate-binding protein [Psychrobacter sp. WB2]